MEAESRAFVADVKRALRGFAWTNPSEVIRYVEQHADTLSSLSKRGVLLERQRASDSDPHLRE